MNRWDDLSLQEKNQLLGIYASKGYTDLASIISHYNTFQSGGPVKAVISDKEHKHGGQLGKVTPYGQWQYPGEVTTIPSNNITMKGVGYPVIGVSDTGDTKYMLPNMDYLFEGKYVTEYPVHKFQDGGDTDGSKKDVRTTIPDEFMIRPQISIADNTKYEKPYTTNEILKEKKKYKQEQLRKNILEAQKKQAYIKEDKNPKSYAEREFDNKVQEIVDQTITQKASPGKIDFNTLETGISTALQAAIIPEAATQVLARPATTLLGLAGIAGSNLAARTFTDYGSLGQALSPDNKLLSSTLDVLNPFGLVGGVYGNGVDKRLAEVLVRRGDALKNGINTTDNVFKHLFPDVPDVTKEMVGKKHPIVSYIFDPRQKDLIYKINDIPKEVLESGFSPAQFKTGYDYNGTNMGRPYRGDIVDIFFNKGVNNTGFDYVRDMPTYFADYMAKNYPHKVPYWFRLGEASVNTPRTRGAKFRTDITDGVGVIPDGSEKSFIDPGGFRKLLEDEAHAEFADIWKYNGDDAIKRYGWELGFVPNGNKVTLKNRLYKPLIKTFGNFIDAHSTPIITQWYDTRPIYIPEVGEYEYNLAHP